MKKICLFIMLMVAVLLCCVGCNKKEDDIKVSGFIDECIYDYYKDSSDDTKIMVFLLLTEEGQEVFLQYLYLIGGDQEAINDIAEYFDEFNNESIFLKKLEIGITLKDGPGFTVEEFVLLGDLN